jgi:anti-anti-sigma factor
VAARRTAKARPATHAVAITVTLSRLQTFNRPRAQSTRAVKHPSLCRNKGAGDRVSRPWRRGQEWTDGTQAASAMREPSSACTHALAWAAAVVEDTYPVRWAGRQVVVTLPEDIDVSNADQIREQLLSVINRGAAVLIADMTATVSCDYVGGEAVIRAYQRAVISGADLRLAVTAQIVRRVLNFNGVDRLVPIYPSLEAAQAVRTPAEELGLAPRPASARAGEQALPACSTPTGGNLPAARPSDKDRAAVTSAEIRSLVDALQDGVALAGGDGVLALASQRLEEMFGYEHGELLGQTVERLIPAHLQAAHRNHRAACAKAPRTRPMTGRLVGLRKDATTFPVEISLSPVTTAAGQFAFAVIRDVTAARHLEDHIDLARSAVTARQAHHGRELLESIIARLFQLGLSLQAAIDLPADVAGQRIEGALEHLDDTIRVIRDTAFATPDPPPARPSPPEGDGPPSW